MWVGVVSLFPEMFNAVTDYGMNRVAADKGSLELNCWNPRDFTLDKHRTVDDRPYGGGPGMLMMVEPLQKAISAAKAAAGNGARVLYMSPQGKKFDQQAAQELAQREKLIFVAGRYEGIDERLIETEIDEEWSIGDYVLSGGELAAMTMIDSIVRLLPGVLGHSESAQQDSFSDGLLDHPHYTRPEVYQGRSVPPVLLSGHHEQIKHWRLKQSLGRSWLRRPELLQQRELSKLEQRLLEEFIQEYK